MEMSMEILEELVAVLEALTGGRMQPEKAIDILANLVSATSPVIRTFMGILEYFGFNIVFARPVQVRLVHVGYQYDYDVVVEDETLTLTGLEKHGAMFILYHEKKLRPEHSCCATLGDITSIAIDPMLLNVKRRKAAKNLLRRNIERLRNVHYLSCDVINYFVLANFIALNVDRIVHAIEELLEQRAGEIERIIELLMPVRRSRIEALIDEIGG